VLASLLRHRRRARCEDRNLPQGSLPWAGHLATAISRLDALAPG
jgi:hypothetical protein